MCAWNGNNFLQFYYLLHSTLLQEKTRALSRVFIHRVEKNSLKNQKYIYLSIGNSNGQNGDDYCCILCGYKEQSVDRLKDHINLHFIGQVKRKHEEASKENNGAESNAKKMKIKEENNETSSSTTSEPLPQLLQISKHSRPGSPQQPLGSPQSSVDEPSSTVAPPTGQLKCNSCDIGFSHLSNFVAHKKYYCRGMQATLRNISTASKEGSNGSESPSK